MTGVGAAMAATDPSIQAGFLGAAESRLEAGDRRLVGQQLEKSAPPISCSQTLSSPCPSIEYAQSILPKVVSQQHNEGYQSKLHAHLCHDDLIQNRAMVAWCKRRHVKCDETSPRCINCVTAQIKCSFEKSSRPGSDYQPAHPSPETATEPPTPNSHRTVSPQSIYAGPVTTTEPDLNFQHLELLHQFCTKTFATFSPEPAQQELWRTLAVRYGLMHPFLMYQMLAVSALHLAHENPPRVDYYSETATVLQNAAMSRFHALEAGINESNCASVLLFSSLLALHVLADPTRTRGLDLPGHVDHLISCIKLMRGVRRLVIHDWWDYLSSYPDLKPLLVIETPSKPYDIPQDVQDLDELPKGSDLSEKAIAAYKDAIEHLHWLYAASEVPRRTYTTGRWILAWPVQLSPGYLDLLDERRPEAMIILCYYAALLYYYRGCWIVGDIGVYLIKAICAHLGGYWEKWLRWPKELVAHVPTP